MALAGVSFPPGYRLEPAAETHAPVMVRWRNDARVRDWFLTQQELTEQGQIAWLRQQQADGGNHNFIVFRLADAEPVAMVAIYDVDAAAGCAEFGRILVDPARHRQGIGSAAIAWALAYGFAGLRLTMIYANGLSDNAASLALMTRAGLRPVGTWRHGASGRLVTRLELTAEDWRLTAPDRGRRTGDAGPGAPAWGRRR